MSLLIVMHVWLLPYVAHERVAITCVWGGGGWLGFVYVCNRRVSLCYPPNSAQLRIYYDFTYMFNSRYRYFTISLSEIMTALVMSYSGLAFITWSIITSVYFLRNSRQWHERVKMCSWRTTRLKLFYRLFSNMYSNNVHIYTLS